LDYSKVAGILRYLNDNSLELVDMEFLPSDFFIEFREGLDLALFVDGGWAKLTPEGKKVLESIWEVLCIVRKLDPKVAYDTPLEFFKAQAQDAEVIPIDTKRKKSKKKK
jgi:hypothetical protein